MKFYIVFRHYNNPCDIRDFLVDAIDPKDAIRKIVSSHDLDNYQVEQVWEVGE